MFGPPTPKDNTPNTVVMEPTTMYGITKVAPTMAGRDITVWEDANGSDAHPTEMFEQEVLLLSGRVWDAKWHR